MATLSLKGSNKMDNKNNRTNKNRNGNSSYKPKNANMKAKNAASGKTVSASSKVENGKKIVKADVVKNGNEIKQKTVTTKLDNKKSNPQAATKNLNNASDVKQKTIGTKNENEQNKSKNESKNTNNQTKNQNAGTESKTQNVEEKNQTKNQTSSKNNSHSHKPSYPANWWLWAIIIIGSTIIAGCIATLLGGKMFNFGNHVLPPAVVPKIVFPIAWALIYILIGVAGFLVFLSPNQTMETRRGDIIWFCINLFLNILWPLFFFRLDMLIFSTIWCGLVLISAIITCCRFYYRNLAGGICYTIYTVWLMYAFYLNLAICLLNA